MQPCLAMTEMMETTIISSVVSVICVFIGFVLVAVWEKYREWDNRHTLKRQLLEELRANLHMISKKRLIIQSAINSLRAGNLVSGECVAFCTTMYNNHYPSICEHFTLIERNSLHVIYEHFRVIDTMLSNYAEQVVQSIIAQKPMYGRAIAELGDLLQNMSILEGLVTKHLAGKPEDVLDLLLPKPSADAPQ